MTTYQFPFSLWLSELAASISAPSLFPSPSYSLNDSLPRISASSTPAIAVTTTNDELNIDQQTSLREAIQIANSTPWDDVIVLNPGRYSMSFSGRNEDSNVTGDFDIQGGMGEITIVGLGQENTDVVIDAQGLDRLFQISMGGTLSLENLTMTGGNADLGGAILNGGTLILKDITFSNHSALSGGAIYTSLGQIRSIDNVTFANNSAQYGGAIYSIFSMSPNTSTIGSISNSTFLNNSAQYGGAIFNYVGSTIGSIVSNTFSQNSAQFFGKDIYNFLGTISNLAQIYNVNNFADKAASSIYPTPSVEKKQ